MSKAFTGVWIPKDIYLAEGLTPTDKLVYADIVNLCSNKGEYFKANDTIAKEIGASSRTVQRSIQKLENEGLITKGFNGRSRTICLSSIDKMAKLPRQNGEAATTNCPTSIQDSIQESKQVSKGVKIIYPYESEIFVQTWMIWLQERKEKKLKKYTQRGEQAQLHNLQKISNYDEATAIKIIEQSITQGWAGLFAIKGAKTNRKALDAKKAYDWAYGK